MSDQNKVHKAFLTPLLRHFRIPDTVENSEVKAFLDDYVTALDKFGDETLRRAASEITVSRTTRTLPTIAECYRACQDAYNEAAAQSYEPRGEKLPPEHPESQARLKLADELIVCDLGLQACEEGWQAGLWGWIRKNGRVPDQREAKTIKRQSLGDQEWIRDAMKEVEKKYGLDSNAFRQLKTALTAMESRKNQIKQKVFAGMKKKEAA